MANVFYGSEITQLAGSIGGISFQKNASGNIAKLRPNLSQSLSEAQILRNIVFADSISAFNQLSSANKLLWKAFATAHSKIDFYGKTKNLTAQNWFTALYCNALSISATPLITPPVWSLVSPPDIPTDIEFDTSYPKMYFEFGSSLSLGGDFLFVYASPLTFENSLVNQSNIFFLCDVSASTLDSLDIYEAFCNLWFAGFDFEVSGLSGVNVRISLFRMSHVTFLISPFTSFLMTAVP